MMQEYSVLIVTRDRKQELYKTLTILEKRINNQSGEILVFLDGCTDNSAELKSVFTNVRWFESEKSIGASAARHFLYPKAQGKYLIGLDDDAHPLDTNFVNKVRILFQDHPKTGILAFQEIKGVFESDESALKSVDNKKQEYCTSEFVGCGFAIRKDVYESTNGFPVWIDIYGEESCVAIEVLANGFDILYSNTIKVNHRVDNEARKKAGRNYFRFGRQLKNTTFYYLVYHPSPMIKIMKLYWHNFKKYALSDFKCFKIFFEVIFEVILKSPKVLQYRIPVNKNVLIRMKELKQLSY